MEGDRKTLEANDYDDYKFIELSYYKKKGIYLFLLYKMIFSMFVVHHSEHFCYHYNNYKIQGSVLFVYAITSQSILKHTWCFIHGKP